MDPRITPEGPTMVIETRPATASPTRASLDAVFRPRAVAVIGASRDRGTIGAEIFHNLIEHGFNGPVYPVNPKADVVQSVHAYPTIEDVPGPVDLAVIVVPGAHVLDVLEACGRKGVRAAVVISAGFKETGPEGAQRERALKDCADRHGMRLIGLNCLGVLNTEAGVRLDATFAPIFPPPGSVAFSSQSGALGLAILEYAKELAIGISHFVSVGNKADVSGNDLLEYWEQDPGTRIILLYLESFGNPRRFTRIARRVGRRKPIVAVKSGRTGAGMRAASSHTGSLAGTDTAVDALCHQSGVIRTDTIEELFDVAMLLANQPVPRGHRVGIVTNAGGSGHHGLRRVRGPWPDRDVARAGDGRRAARVPAARGQHQESGRHDRVGQARVVRARGPARARRRERRRGARDLRAADRHRPLDVAQAIVRGTAAAAHDATAAGVAPKPVLSCFMGSHGVAEGLRSMQEGHIPSYAFPESAAIALARAVRYGRWLEAPEGKTVTFPDVDSARAARALSTVSREDGGDATWLGPEAVRELLAAYGLPTPVSRMARSADEAAAAARAIGFPVAIKLVSETITHKSDVGGVVLDVRNQAEARAAFESIARRLVESGRVAEMDGVTVQPMVRDGHETIIGVTLDPSFDRSSCSGSAASTSSC